MPNGNPIALLTEISKETEPQIPVLILPYLALDHCRTLQNQLVSLQRPGKQVDRFHVPHRGL